MNLWTLTGQGLGNTPLIGGPPIDDDETVVVISLDDVTCALREHWAWTPEGVADLIETAANTRREEAENLAGVPRYNRVRDRIQQQRPNVGRVCGTCRGSGVVTTGFPGDGPDPCPECRPSGQT